MFSHALDALVALAGAMKEKVAVTYLVLLLVIAVNVYQIERMLDTQENLSRMVATEYAFDVVAYGLRGADDDSSIVSTVRDWKVEGKDGQVAAVINVCDNAPFRLDGLMKEDTRRSLCRIVRAG